MIMASFPAASYLFSMNLAGSFERCDVLVLVGDQLLIDTIPVQQFEDMEKRFRNQEPLDQLLHPDARAIPLRSLSKVQVNTGSGSLKAQVAVGGREEELSLAIGIGATASEFCEALRQRLGWQSSSQPVSRLKITLSCWGAFLLFAGVTAFFYVGIKQGFIHQGPAWLAFIANTFSVTGVLVIGCLLMLMALALWVVSLRNPGTIVTLTPQTLIQ
jgi:hypothetical protein